ncbi:unnamed protein product [Heligmosomoides polygyrus]|uniref:Secreted protein n=1 Tax=Heligmosomoides polygyrus TaxID=6339 RepID=A0A183FZ96_HELPZ|nr:unnamed protein product [Heligmosomoides polygyrus]
MMHNVIRHPTPALPCDMMHTGVAVLLSPWSSSSSSAAAVLAPCRMMDRFIAPVDDADDDVFVPQNTIISCKGAPRDCFPTSHDGNGVLSSRSLPSGSSAACCSHDLHLQATGCPVFA